MEELTLQEIQQGSFRVLLKFKEICETNNLRYFLAYGTLIGAIRHKGFIPWDDDIDVWMPRPDYEKFIQYCIDNEMGYFILKHYKTCKEYIYPIARLVDSRYKIEYTNAKEYGLGLFIDIYPLDGLKSECHRQSRKRRSYIRKISILCRNQYISSPNKLKNILKKIYYEFHKNKSLNKILSKSDKFAKKYKYNDYENIACTVWETTECFDKSDFTSSVDVEFNGEIFKAPNGYDNLLKKTYGDYMKMPPECERIAHHFYRAYKK